MVLSLRVEPSAMADKLGEAELKQLEADMKKANKFFEDSKCRFDRLEGLMEAILQSLDKLDRKMESSGTGFKSGFKVGSSSNAISAVHNQQSYGCARPDPIETSIVLMKDYSRLDHMEAARARIMTSLGVEDWRLSFQNTLNRTTHSPKSPSVLPTNLEVPAITACNLEEEVITDDCEIIGTVEPTKVRSMNSVIDSIFNFNNCGLAYAIAKSSSSDFLTDMNPKCLINCYISFHASIIQFPFFTYIYDPGIAIGSWFLIHHLSPIQVAATVEGRDVTEYNGMNRAYDTTKIYGKTTSLVTGPRKQGTWSETYNSTIQMIYGADLVNQAREILTPEHFGRRSNAIQVHQKMLQVGIKLNEVVCGSIINGFAKYDNLEELVKYFQKEEGSGILSNLNGWLSSLKSYCKIGLEGATTIYQRMMDVKGGLAIVACSSMIGLFADLSMVFEFKLVFGNLKEKDSAHGGTFAVMMYLYDKMSILDNAIETAQEIKLLGLLKDCVSYNKLLVCYVINRKLHKCGMTQMDCNYSVKTIFGHSRHICTMHKFVMLYDWCVLDWSVGEHFEQCIYSPWTIDALDKSWWTWAVESKRQLLIISFWCLTKISVQQGLMPRPCEWTNAPYCPTTLNCCYLYPKSTYCISGSLSPCFITKILLCSYFTMINIMPFEIVNMAHSHIFHNFVWVFDPGIIELGIQPKFSSLLQIPTVFDYSRRISFPIVDPFAIFGGLIGGNIMIMSDHALVFVCFLLMGHVIVFHSILRMRGDQGRYFRRFFPLASDWIEGYRLTMNAIETVCHQHAQGIIAIEATRANGILFNSPRTITVHFGFVRDAALPHILIGFYWVQIVLHVGMALIVAWIVLLSIFLNLDLEGKVHFNGGGNVMVTKYLGLVDDSREGCNGPKGVGPRIWLRRSSQDRSSHEHKERKAVIEEAGNDLGSLFSLPWTLLSLCGSRLYL